MLVAFLFLFLAPLTAQFTSSRAARQLPHADLILVNGNVRTLDPKKPRAEAIAVSGGKIIAVGSNKLIRSLAGERTRTIDAAGRLVLPGFNDAHVHFAAVGNKFSSIDLRGLRTAEEMAAKFAEYARYLPKGRWVLGSGFDPVLLRSGQLKKLADAATPDNPVFVYSADTRTAFANAAAYSRAGLGHPGAEDGFLSGEAVRRVASAVPREHSKNWAEILETATNYAASLGVTSVQDMHSDELADVYRELDRAGKLKTRVYDCSPVSATSKLAALGVKAATGDAMVRTGCVKTFTDGDEADAVRLEREIAASDEAGLQVMVHAMGSQANRIVLDAFERAVRSNGIRDRRFRIEHAHNAADDDLPRFARAGIIASMQPWLFFGADRTSAFERHLKLGTRMAFGSDASIAELDPLLGIQAATTGRGAIGLDDALRAYTIGSAHAEFQDKIKGSLESGKVADLVILEGNLEGISQLPARMPRVIATFVDGKQTFGAML